MIDGDDDGSEARMSPEGSRNWDCVKRYRLKTSSVGSQVPVVATRIRGVVPTVCFVAARDYHRKERGRHFEVAKLDRAKPRRY